MPLGTIGCSETPTPSSSSSSWTTGIGASRCGCRLCKNQQPYRYSALHHGADRHHPYLPSRPRQGRCQQRWQAQLLRTSDSARMSYTMGVPFWGPSIHGSRDPPQGRDRPYVRRRVFGAIAYVLFTFKCLISWEQHPRNVFVNGWNSD